MSVSSAISQSQKIVLKFKKDTPDIILNNIKNKNYQITGFTKINPQILNSYQLFSNFQNNFSKLENDEFGLDKIFILEVNSNNKEFVIKEIKKVNYIEYAEEVHSTKLENFIPNDKYYSNQYYLNSINIQPVWDTQLTGDILVGVVDSGLDFLHPDLQQSYFINQGEYGNGKENNGIDDDNNGFIDDWRGWNFQTNKNDPTDDNIYSHGTAVSGIISAGFNNGIGISSITGGKAKVLALKCFDAQGIGYEDYVATAILYGVSKGVKVFNFSFGDYIYSNLLRDVIRYAYSKNITIVCSAGNDNTDVLHYPSSYDEVISVAASDEIDRKATFSTYGQTVDIYAPGVNIFTTSRIGFGNAGFDSNYAFANGTSFSAPIVVSIAALLKLKNPNLSNEEIRGILVSSAKYFQNQNSWDYVYSSGIANANTSFSNSNNPSVARIYFPYLNYTTTQNQIPLYISAASAFFTSYKISYGIGLNPSIYNDIFSSSNQIIKDTATHLNLQGLPDTLYTLKLSVSTNNFKTIEHRTVIAKNNSTPQVVYENNSEIVYKNSFAEFVNFGTNVLTTGIIHLKRRNINEPYTDIYTDENNIGYNSYEHYTYLKHFELIPDTEYEYYAEAKALNGKSVILPHKYFTAKSQIYKFGFVKKSYNLPLSQICDNVISLNNNDSKVLFVNNIKNNLSPEAYNFSNNKFIKISPANYLGNYVIRDAKDLENDGKLELLTSQQRNGFLFSADNAGALPNALIWNNSSDDFWSAKMNNNLNPEIFGFARQGLKVIRKQNNTFVEAGVMQYSLPNPFANSQNVLTSDFNNNQLNDVIFTNSNIDTINYQNTNLNIYEKNGSFYSLQKILSYPQLIIKGDNLCTGKIRNSNQNFAVGLNYDSQTQLKIFVVIVYEYVNNEYTEIASKEFFNNGSNDGYIKLSDIDNDGKDELLVNIANNFYVLKYNASSNNLDIIYNLDNINTYNSVVYDFDGNGIKELSLNNNDSTIFIEKDINTNIPLTPNNFTGYSLDSNKVVLNFLPVQNANLYKIYRSFNDTNFVVYDSVNTNQYFDNNVSNRKNYFYKISAIDNLNRESKLTNSIKIFVHNKSHIISAVYNENLLALKFSENISSQIPSINSFYINNINPYSVGIKSNNEYALSFNPELNNGNYNIYTKNLYDYYGSPVDSNILSFTVNKSDSISFYLKSAELLSSNTLKLIFNLNCDSNTTLNNNNYSFEPFNLKVINVKRDIADKKTIYITLNSQNNIGSSGKTYFVRISNIFSESGIKLREGSGSVFSLVFVKEDLKDVVTYPNPFNRNKSNSQKLTFANLTNNVKIYIYNLSGEIIKELNETTNNGGIEWDVKDSQGRELPTGIYLYKVEGKNSSGVEVESKLGKFAIIK